MPKHKRLCKLAGFVGLKNLKEIGEGQYVQYGNSPNRRPFGELFTIQQIELKITEALKKVKG